jgi:hypothetical protein
VASQAQRPVHDDAARPRPEEIDDFTQKNRLMHAGVRER